MLPQYVFRDVAAAYLRRHAHQWAPRTVERYTDILARQVLPVLGDVALECVTRRALCALFDAMLARPLRPLKPRSVRLACALVTAMLNDAVDAELLAVNVAHRLIHRYPAPADEVAFYAPSEVAAFLDVARVLSPNVYYPLFATLAGSALRIGEARGLRAADVDAERCQLRITRQIDRWGRLRAATKSRRARAVPVVASLLPVLSALVAARSKDAWLFPTLIDRGGYKRAYTAMRKIAARAGIPVASPKAFRHGLASYLISQGVETAGVAEMLGHASEAFTREIYGSHIPVRRHPIFDRL